MFSKPSTRKFRRSHGFFVALFVMLLTVTSVRRPEISRGAFAPRQNYEFISVRRPDKHSRRLGFLAEEFNGGISVALVNFDGEEEFREWAAVGETTAVRFERVSPELKWGDFFPEWIDEEQRSRVPRCPPMPMPRFKDYGEFDVVVAKIPCGGDGGSGRRDVYGLQVHLVAANLAVRNGRKGGGGPLVVVTGACGAMGEIFRCENLVSREGDVRVYRPDKKRLTQKMALPPGSCQLSLPLVKNGEGKLEYDFSRVESPLDDAKEAYMTLLHSSEAYVCGAIVLARSIIETNSTKDLVLLADGSISRRSRRGLEAAGWRVRDIERIRSPFAKKGAYNEWNYSKLRIWQQTDYDKVIFIDSDFILLKNLDAFFASPQLSAAGNDRFVFNSGIMLVEPSQCMFERLISEKERLQSYNGGDQGYLNEVFTWWHRWPKRVNWLKNFRSLNTSREVPREVYAAHYLGTKPWICGREYDCNWEKKGGQIFASDAAHRRWWEVYDRMPQPLRRFCELSRSSGSRLKKKRLNAQTAL